MAMVPYSYKEFTGTLLDEVKAGRVSTRRVDDAVSRILTQKFRLGLFEHPYADTRGASRIGSAAHRAVAREAAAESQVLLKNSHGLLPLSRHQKVYVAGSNADDLGNQTGGWTITWQGSSGDITKGTTILEGMREAGGRVTYSKDASASTSGYDVGVVVVGETPYAEGAGDVGNGHDLELTAADRAAVDTVCGAMKCVVLVVSWLPGTEGEGVADVLYGRRPFTGQLPVTWPKSMSQLPINVGDAAYDPQFPFGWGLRTGTKVPKGGLDTLRALTATAKAADRRGADRQGREAVGKARLLVQQRIAATLDEATAKPFAEADRALLRGRYGEALSALTRAYRAAGR
jgi:beta-glucosidase